MNKINSYRFIFVVMFVMFGMFSIICNGQINTPAFKSDTIFSNNFGAGVSYRAVLDQNPFDVVAADISEIKILKTLFSGQVIFDANSDLGYLIDSEESRLIALNNFKASGHICSKHCLELKYNVIQQCISGIKTTAYTNRYAQ